MKQIKQQLLLTVALLLSAISVSAYSFSVDGIYYNIVSSSSKTCSVTYKTSSYNSYSGMIVVPSKVTYNSAEYTVTGIGDYAFRDCTSLTYIKIPETVTSIGRSAFSGCSGLTTVTIPNSVKSIGEYAFYYCSGLTSVTIPNSVKSIGDYAFSGCSGLTSIKVDMANKYYDSRNNCNAIINSTTNELVLGCKNTIIPNSVTSIGNYAFNKCSGLTSVTIPNSVTSIGNYAFNKCSGLTSVTIPNSVTSIGEYAFSYCSGLTSVTIGNSVTSIGGSAFEYCYSLTKAEFASIESLCNMSFGISLANPLYYAHNLYIGGKEVKDLTIPESVTSIGNSAFSGCSGLTSVTIPNSVTSIGYYAFSGCSGLTSVTIGNSVTSIGNNAFYECTKLFEVYNLSSLNLITGDTNNGYVAYYAKVIHTSSDEPSNYEDINGFQFINLEVPQLIGYTGSETNITLPENFKGKNYKIADRAFYNCSGLTSVSIPNSVTSIGNNAFNGCSGLTKAEFASIESLCNMSFGSSLDNPLYYAHNLYIGGKEVKDLTIPESVTSIGDYAFSGCSGLTSVTIPNSVTSIGSYAFRGCSGLTSVTIPNSVTSIGRDAFSGCSGLTQAEFASIESLCNISFGDAYANPLYYAHNLYIGGKEVKDLTIPESVTSIGSYAFYECSGLTSVTIPNSVTSIGKGAFLYSGLTSIVWNAKKCKDFYTNSDAYFAFPTTIESITFGDDVEYIPAYLCYRMTGLTSVTIPNSVISIGDYAFSGCSGLTSVTIPNSVTSIGYSAFSGCSGLTSVTIPNSVTSIGDYAFSGCSGLTKAEFASIESLCNISFGGTNANPLSYVHNLYIDGKEVKDLVIPNSVTSIGNYAFYECTGLTSVTIPNSVTEIGEYAFRGCSGLSTVTIPNSVTSIGNYAYSNCSGLESVTIGSGVTTIGERSFYKSSISKVVNLSSTPQSSAGALSTYTGVHVLKGCKSAYSNSSVWKKMYIIEDAESLFPLQSVSMEKEKIYVKIDSIFTLTPIVEPSVALTSIYDRIWMTSDPSVLYFDHSTQRFMAMKEGTATVTVTIVDDYNKKKMSASATVYVGDGIDPEESGDPQCDAPIVKYTNGNIICVSATDNAVCHYTCKIMGESEGEDTGSSAGIPLKIEITAYATAEGYRQSKNTVKAFDYIPSGSGLKGDMNGDGVVNMQDANIIVNKYLGK